MVSKPWRTTRPKQVNEKKLMQLEQTVKDVLNSATVEAPALTISDSELLKEIADLKLKLAAALEQGAMDRLKARQLEAVETERDTLKQQLDTLTAAQPLPVAVTNCVECSIQYDVKSPELARWRNDGWEVKHYEFVDNDRSLPVLAVVMERPAAPAPRIEDEYHYSATPPADTPRNDVINPVNEAVPMAVIIEEVPNPQPLPHSNGEGEQIVIVGTPVPMSLLDKLAADKPIFAAIKEYGADAVLDAMNAQVYEKARAVYDAYDIPNDPPRRFESLLSPLNPPALQGEVEIVEIEVVLS